MGIQFSGVPNNLRVPFVAVEFNNQYAQQGPAQLNYRALLIGQKTSAGSGTANTIVKVSNVDQVIALAGRGSMLHRQALAFFANNRFTDCYIGILADNGAGVRPRARSPSPARPRPPARSASTSAA
jgi:phage tail sheath gpL-like